MVLENGKYAQRIADLCRSSGFDVEVIPLNMKAINDALMTPFNRIVGVISVHCETSTGMINPVDNIAAAVKKCKPGICKLWVQFQSLLESWRILANFRRLKFRKLRF